jgi:hypothetical protein
MQLQLLRCSGVVLLKNVFKSEQGIVRLRPYVPMNGWMKCSIRPFQLHVCSQTLQGQHALWPTVSIFNNE